jgi:hypothetical protein
MDHKRQGILFRRPEIVKLHMKDVVKLPIIVVGNG